MKGYGDANVCVCDTRGMLDVLSYVTMKPSEYKFSWLKWVPYIGWKCACESVHYLKCDALLYYEKYDMIICYIIMACDASVNWMHKLGLWHNSGLGYYIVEHKARE